MGYHEVYIDLDENEDEVIYFTNQNDDEYDNNISSMIALHDMNNVSIISPNLFEEWSLDEVREILTEVTDDPENQKTISSSQKGWMDINQMFNFAPRFYIFDEIQLWSLNEFADLKFKCDFDTKYDEDEIEKITDPRFPIYYRGKKYYEKDCDKNFLKQYEPYNLEDINDFANSKRYAIHFTDGIFVTPNGDMFNENGDKVGDKDGMYEQDNDIDMDNNEEDKELEIFVRKRLGQKNAELCENEKEHLRFSFHTSTYDDVINNANIMKLFNDIWEPDGDHNHPIHAVGYKGTICITSTLTSFGDIFDDDKLSEKLSFSGDGTVEILCSLIKLFKNKRISTHNGVIKLK